MVFGQAFLEISKAREIKVESVEKQILELIAKGVIFILDVVESYKFDFNNCSC